MWSCFHLLLPLLLLLIRLQAAAEVMTGEHVCGHQYISTSISSFDKLSDCRVIEGYLKIVLFDHTLPSDFTNLTFPNLVEITEYLLVFRVSGLQSLGRLFPNLAVIRGQKLFYDYALIVYRMNSLTELDLQQLRSIDRGAVRIQRNPQLCYADTINWDLIATSAQEAKRIHETSENKNKRECPKCRSSCPTGPTGPSGMQQHLCWSSDKCQIVCNTTCGPRSCMQNDSSICCHHQCLGGCTGPESTDCIACRGVVHGRTCMKTCPVPKQGITYYEFLERRCVEPSECIRHESVDELTGKREPYKQFDRDGKAGWCLEKCPSNYEPDKSNPSKCNRCKGGKCPVTCQGGRIRNVQEAQRYRGCTRVLSGVEINILRSSSGAGNVVLELEHSLQDVEEIDGHLKIHRSFPLVSLYFFKKLRLITGRTAVRQNYSLAIDDNVNMKELFDWKSRNYLPLEIRHGKIFIANNPKLCLKKIEMLKNYTNIKNWTELDVNPHTNGDREACEIIDLEIRVELNPRAPSSAMIWWKNVKPLLHDPRTLMSYNVFWRPAPYNVSKYDGKDACSTKNDVWDSVEREVIDIEELYTILTNLMPATRYALYIQAYMASTASKGGETDVVYFVTVPDEPSDPADVLGNGINDTAIMISWTKPKSPNGVVTHYILNFQPVPQLKEPEKDYCDYDFTPSIQPIPDSKLVTTVSPVVPISTSHSSSSSINGGASIFGKQMSNDEQKCCQECMSVVDTDEGTIEGMTFEDFLHNAVYIKKAAAGGSSTSSSASRRRRSINAQDDVVHRLSAASNRIHLPSDDASPSSRTDPFTESMAALDASSSTTASSSITSTSSTTSSHDDSNSTSSTTSSPVTPQLPVDNSFNITVPATNQSSEMVVVPNLSHFNSYDVRVIACHAAIKPGVPKLCSQSTTSQITVQTHSRPSADDIDAVTVEGDSSSNSSTNGIVYIKWSAPVAPNGDILSYSVKLQRSGREQADIKCVNETEFLKNGFGWKSGDLLPGEYTVRVRANSLAGNGNWSVEQKFTVTDLSAMSWTKIFLITFFVLASFIASTGLISFYVFKKARQNLPNHLEYVSMNPEYMPAYEPDEWEVLRDDVELLEELGEGSFGKVYRGNLKNTVNGMTVQECAVKTVNDRASARDKIEFLQEASLMKEFKCHHVVKLLGVVSTGSPVYVCMELMKLGDLKNYLRKCRPDCQGGPEHSLPTKALVHLMSCQIADGMAYLATRKYVHRDLAGRNCMMAADLTVKIGDFGMTRDVYETDYYRRGARGRLPVRWMAQESLRDGTFSSQSDVWSFGVVLWEIVTLGEQPYQGYSNEKVMAFIKCGGSPGRPENCPEDLFSVMSLCWSWHPKARPTFGEIIDSLLPEIEDTEMGSRFKKYSYYIAEKSSCTVVNFEDEQHEASPLTNDADACKDVSQNGAAGEGEDEKPKFMPSHIDFEGFLQDQASGDDDATLNKASGTNTMSIRSAALSTVTGVTNLSNMESSSEPSTRHNSNTTTASTATEDQAVVQQMMENDNNSNTTIITSDVRPPQQQQNNGNRNNSNTNSPSPTQLVNGRVSSQNSNNKSISAARNGLNGSTDNSKGSDGSKGSVISNGTASIHEEYRIRNSIL